VPLRPLAAAVVAAGLLGAPAAADASPWSRLRGLVGLGAPVDEVCELGEEVVGGQVEPGAREVVVAVQKKLWEAAHGGEEAAKPFIRARLAGWPTKLLGTPSPPGASDREFVSRLARDTWRGLDAFVDRENHLPIDNVRFGDDVRNGRVGDYTNVTSVGLRMIAIVAAHDLGFVSADDAVARLRDLLATLARLETFSGFFYNYYDTTSLERTSNLISFVDSSWLTAGLMVVRSAFPELAGTVTPLIEGGDYSFFYDAGRRRMSHGYWVQLRARSKFHYGVLYAESRLGSLIAIGKGEAPPAHWFSMVRTFPPACRWQTQSPHGRRPKTIAGTSFFGGWYEWKDTRYVPSWGGSMFEALMPTLVVDEPAWAPASLGANDVAHAEGQRRFAVEELGYPVWGMSPSSTPAGDGYGEYGVRVLGSLGYPPGAVTAHAAALALAVTPEAAVADLRTLATRYAAYGEYGLYDAVDPASGAVAHAYLALDQAMIFIAAANYLADHAAQKHFAADPIAARALPVLATEHFFD
jgi:hypothetical protein